jgi:hypothetical protein
MGRVGLSSQESRGESPQDRPLIQSFPLLIFFILRLPFFEYILLGVIKTLI